MNVAPETRSLIDRYIRLFRGRGDAHGTWYGGTAVDDNGERIPLTYDHFTAHLCSPSKADWIGVYPHLGSRGVTWGCIDIDGKDFDHDWEAMARLARTLRVMAAVKDVYLNIEVTKNGYHLWVFPLKGIGAAADMRRALMAVCKASNYSPKEVNPKQEELAANRLGNYVRLPYYGWFADTTTAPDRYFINAATEQRLALPDFLDTVEMTSNEALTELAKLWTPPERVTFDGPPPEDVERILKTVSGLAFTVWKNGPLEGRDRSNTLAKLAYTLRDEELEMASAFAVVRDADRRWGKFFDRPDGDEQIMNIVEHAYSN